jgi:DNA-binding GntR family transcriptional regulator
MVQKSGEGGSDGMAEAVVSSSDRLFREVVRGLHEGTFVAGQRLVESDLMRRFSLGRSSVREGLKRLAAEGLVTVHPFRGAQIRHLTRKEAEDVLVVLEMTLGLAARLAAAGIGISGAASQFRSAYDQLSRFSGERDSYDLVRARNRFYRVMTQIGGNREVERLLFGLQINLLRPLLRQSQEQRFKDYHRLADAILSGDQDAAEAAGRAHIRNIRAVMADAPSGTFAVPA